MPPNAGAILAAMVIELVPGPQVMMAAAAAQLSSKTRDSLSRVS
jgi:hypothetical protein